MSLLNDMLRDLSAVQKPSDGELNSPTPDLELKAHEQRELLQQSSVVKPLPATLLPSLVVFVVVLIILIAWKQNFPAGNDAPEFDANSATTISTSPLSEPVQSTATDEKSVVATATADAKIQSPEQKNEAALTERLAALESAITRLSSAVEESTAIEQANVAMSYVAAETPAAYEDDMTNTDVVQSPDQPVSEPIRDPFELAATPAAPSQHERVSQNEVMPRDAHLSIAPNPVAADQRHADQARQLIAQGQESDAIILLQAFIANAKVPRESTKALLDAFGAQENVQEMNKLIASANYLSTVDKHFYRAKVAIIEEHEANAIQILESGLDEAGDQENYRALLAGLYQRSGKYQEAAALYRRLLASVGEKPAYWLGFALAQDSLNQPQTAKQAYLRLAGYSDLQPQVRTYIQQRLAALQ